MIMIEDDDETPQPSADDEIRAAFGSVIGAILDGYEASPARQKACEEVLRCHARVLRMLAPPPKSNGITALWLDSALH
jgi:hypothetical protein